MGYHIKCWGSSINNQRAKYHNRKCRWSMDIHDTIPESVGVNKR